MTLIAKKCLGIDIGVSSIKIVELALLGKKKKLENYAEFIFPSNSKLKTFKGENLFTLDDETADILKAIFKTSGIKEKKANLSIPDFSTFFTTFTLPPMEKTEVDQAIEFEARHHIPIPLDEVTFDWQILDKKESFPGLELKILLVAVPNKILANYQKITNLAKITLKGMEAEVFGLIRSCVNKKDSEKPVCLVDIGWQSTTVSVVEKAVLLASYSFDISSKGLTKSLSSSLNISLDEAEKLKKENGLDPQKEDVVKILATQLDSLAFEIDKVCKNFQQTDNKKIERIVLAGGTASLFGLKEYLESRTKKEVQIADPLSSVSCPSDLKDRLSNIGPSFAVAVGTAMMGLESH